MLRPTTVALKYGLPRAGADFHLAPTREFAVNLLTLRSRHVLAWERLTADALCKGRMWFSGAAL